MPITNVPLSHDQFEYLQQNVTDQVFQVMAARDIAYSGLHYCVLMQVDAPEVDLVNPFNDQLSRMDGLQNLTNWVAITTAMNTHVIVRTSSVGSLSDRLNAYLTAYGVLVTPTYAELSAIGGFIIDPSHIL